MAEQTTLRTVLDVATLIGVWFGVATYWRNARLKRAEWLYNLHSKFYESVTYKRIRHILDYEPPPEFDKLRNAVTSGGSDELVEAFVDYLNFFEFIASLSKLGQLTLTEIAMVFEYYVLRLRDHDFVVSFIKDKGFENLADLIAQLARAKNQGSKT